MRTLFSAAAAIGMVLLAAPASAATFTANLTVSAFSGTNGTELTVSDVANPLIFDLEVGQWATVNLFRLTIDDPNGIDHSSDETANPISVLFNFTTPGTANTTVTGLTEGHIVSGPDFLSVEWDNSSLPLSIGGYGLLITLLDTQIQETCTQYYHDRCKAWGGSGKIKAKFKVTDEPNPVPLPAAWPLFATGLGVAGWVQVARRRRAAGRLA
jgi:hypothetical protein